MALAQETDILLLDEPTTYLDLAYQLEVLDLLQELNLAGRTIVMVLHDLNQACRYAHHIIALCQGKIWAQGTPQEVLTAEMLADVFHVDAHIVSDPVTGMPMCVPIGRAMRVSQAAIEPQQLVADGAMGLRYASPAVAQVAAAD